MNKANVIVIAILLLMFSTAVFAQRITAKGIKGGLNIATITGDDIEGFDSKMGFVFGGFLTYEVNETFSFQPEVLFSRKGTKFENEYIDDEDKDYMISDWRKMLQSFPKAPLPKLTYFCYNKDTIIGSIIGYIIPKKNKKYLYSICVHPVYRGKSIGEYLLQVILQAEPLIPCYLTVYETAKPALNLYKKFGFKKIKTVEAIVANEVNI